MQKHRSAAGAVLFARQAPSRLICVNYARSPARLEGRATGVDLAPEQPVGPRRELRRFAAWPPRELRARPENLRIALALPKPRRYDEANEEVSSRFREHAVSFPTAAHPGAGSLAPPHLHPAPGFYSCPTGAAPVFSLKLSAAPLPGLVAPSRQASIRPAGQTASNQRLMEASPCAQKQHALPQVTRLAIFLPKLGNSPCARVAA